MHFSGDGSQIDSLSLPLSCCGYACLTFHSGIYAVYQDTDVVLIFFLDFLANFRQNQPLTN